MTPKENCNGNLRKSISGIFGKKFMGIALQCSDLITRKLAAVCLKTTFSD
jgi:hypothetical protein